MKRVNVYGSGQFWLFQIIGWAAVSIMLAYWNIEMNEVEKSNAYIFAGIFLFLGVGLSFLYRQYMVQSGWLKMNLTRLFPRIIIGSVVFGTIFTAAISVILWVFILELDQIISLAIVDALVFFINATLIFLLWSSIYLNYNHYKNYEKEEIKNLKLIASQKEIELQSLKSQLNPHFIFNAMNSIRALIEEDPSLAKNAITKLSSILRNSLVASKREYVTIEEEIDIVKKYMSLEKIRYEERLTFTTEIEEEAMTCKIPPLLISTLIENAVKHGIANITEGGQVLLRIKVMEEFVHIEIMNPGQYYDNNVKGTGIGLINTSKRLNIMFDNKAKLDIANHSEKTVKTTVVIPKK